VGAASILAKTNQTYSGLTPCRHPTSATGEGCAGSAAHSNAPFQSPADQQRHDEIAFDSGMFGRRLLRDIHSIVKLPLFQTTGDRAIVHFALGGGSSPWVCSAGCHP